MAKLFAEAIVLGFMLSMLIGPVFFALIKTSIKRGFKAGIFFALGVMTSDLTCLILANWGASQFIYDGSYGKVIGIGGGILLLIFGLYEIFHNDNFKDELSDNNEQVVVKPKILTNFIKAYLMNIMTPFVFIFWIFWAGLINAKYKNDLSDVFLFFTITLLTVFSFDTLKAYLANQLKAFISGKHMRIVHYVAGGLLIIFGLYLLFYVCVNGTSGISSSMIRTMS